MPKYHLIDKAGNLVKVYSGVEVDIRERVIRLFSQTPNFETEAVISLAPGDRLEHVHENR